MKRENWLNDIILEGKHVSLIPLRESHTTDLLKAAEDGKLWELWYTSVPSKHTIKQYIYNALEQKAAGTSLPFVVIDKQKNKIIGSTRYCNAAQQHRRLEIGYTWYSKSYQQTMVNTECKYLLLSHAFDTLNCGCVQFLTNWHNLQSRKAISRLGAKQDGVLRNDRINPDRSFRDTVVYSIIASEWPAVKNSLLYYLSKYP